MAQRAHKALENAIEARRKKHSRGENTYDRELRRCCIDGDVPQLVHFLKLGAKINAGNYNQDTALHMAAMAGNGNCVPALHEYSANLNQQNASGETPLHLAAAMDRLEAIRALVTLKVAYGDKHATR